MENPPDDSFIPLTSPASDAGEDSDFRLVVMSQGDDPRPIHSGAHSASVSAPLSPGAGAEPRITLQREGDRVSAIQIRCACGQTIELACLYEPALPATPPPSDSDLPAPDTGLAGETSPPIEPPAAAEPASKLESGSGKKPAAKASGKGKASRSRR